MDNQINNNASLPVLKDPGHTSDAEFFGIWNEPENKWDNGPILQYGKFNGLNGVLTSVKEGNYEKAKNNLLDYYRKRTGVSQYKSSVSRRYSFAAKMMAEKIFSFLQNDYGVGEANVSQEWKYYTADLTTLAKTYFLLDCEADGSFIEAYSKEHPDDKPAILEVVADGVKMTFTTVADTYISAGANKNSNYGNKEILYIREAAGTCNIPFSSDTVRPYFRFDVGDINGNVSSVKLKFYARSSAGTKRVFVVTPSNEKDFDENKLTWASHYPQIFNFKETGDIWGSGDTAPQKFWGVEFEWLHFGTRLYPAGWCVAEYAITGNELYAYRALEMLISLYAQQKSGIYPRVLEGGWRTEYLCEVFFGTLNSECATPETLTAQLKYMYAHLADLKDADHQTANWESAIRVGFIRICAYLPEIMRDGWWEHGKKRLAELYSRNMMNPDNSYLESTSGYISGVVDEFKLCLNLIKELESGDDPYYKYILGQYKKLTTYFFNMAMNYGRTAPWGDGGRSDIKGFARRENEFYPNPHFEYFATGGQSGTEPDYYSILYPDKAIAFLRSGWLPEDFSAVIHTDFGGNHSHYDDLGLDVYAYGTPLLIEAGNSSYSPGSLMAETRLKTISHNTIEIDNKDQNRSSEMVNMPQKLLLAANRLFDFAETGSKMIYPGFDVNRKVLFLHNSYWIVSDYIIPPSGPHTYKQLWHPDARNGVKIDPKTKIAATSYESGANIYIVPADSETIEAKIDEMYMHHPATLETKADYVRYIRENATGTQTFDTVLYPVKEGETASVGVERVELQDTPSVTATALKITAREITGWYYSSNETVPSLRSFGGYSTDGQMAYAETDCEGEIKLIALTKAKTLKKGDICLVDCGGVQNDLGILWDSDTLNLYSQGVLPESGIKVHSNRQINNVTFNGKEAAFTYKEYKVSINGQL